MKLTDKLFLLTSIIMWLFILITILLLIILILCQRVVKFKTTSFDDLFFINETVINYTIDNILLQFELEKASTGNISVVYRDFFPKQIVIAIVFYNAPCDFKVNTCHDFDIIQTSKYEFQVVMNYNLKKYTIKSVTNKF